MGQMVEEAVVIKRLFNYFGYIRASDIVKPNLPNATTDYVQGFSDGAQAARSIDGYVSSVTGFKQNLKSVHSLLEVTAKLQAILTTFEKDLKRTLTPDVSMRDTSRFLSTKWGEINDYACDDAEIHSRGVEHAQGIFAERRQFASDPDQAKTGTGSI